jgi:pilus assembly protein CpaB
MNRSTRTLIVVALAVGLAGVATFLVYRMIQARPAKEVEVAHAYAVVAAHPLTLGAMLTPNDVKVVPWPAANQVPGVFTKIEDVVNRGVISPISENEPITNNNLAGKDSGAGLPPTIPTGMRAISVRVNEVIGVAGFVVPGTHVDVMVLLNQQAGNSLARVVVSNVQVLAAGTRIDQELVKEGKALPSSVVTLLVSPEDAQLIGLAGNQGQILLTLRNPLDTAPTNIPGSRTANLSGGSVPAPPPAPATTDAPATAPRPRRAATPPPPPPPAPAPEVKKPNSVQFIRGAKVTEEVIKKGGGGL